MTATQVRRLPDGEELVLVEGQGASPACSDPDPREAAFDRRSQAMSDDGWDPSPGVVGRRLAHGCQGADYLRSL